MTLQEAMQARHSVRQYLDRPIDADAARELGAFIEACNRESGLHIQLCLNEPEAFTGMMARYGSFRNVKNYIALVGPKGADFEERCGYYGEQVVLKAAQLGLNTCWVALTFKKSKNASVVLPGEERGCVIALGYGATQGVPHRNRPIEQLCEVRGGTLADAPTWFRQGMEAVMLAPTALNQQKFRFTLDGDRVTATALRGPHARLDLGIAKYHFELGSGRRV